MKKLILLILTLITSQIDGKVLIITHHYNRPDFIELQKKTFDFFLKDDYEFVIFNDAPNQSMKIKIEQKCLQLGLHCIRIPQHLHASDNSPGSRHIHGMDYSFQVLGYDHDDIVMLIDSDMFLIKPFCIREYMEGNALVGRRTWREKNGKRVTHLSPILDFMDMPNLPNKRSAAATAVIRASISTSYRSSSVC